jgi:hypothetical protein
MPRTNSSLPYFTRRSRQSQSIRLHIRTIFCFPNILEETFSDSLPNTHGVWHHGYWLLGTILHATSKEVKCPPYLINIRFFFILLSVVLTYLYLACTYFVLLAFSRISFNISWDSDSPCRMGLPWVQNLHYLFSHSYVAMYCHHPVGGAW